jgi:hypothetical protein
MTGPAVDLRCAARPLTIEIAGGAPLAGIHGFAAAGAARRCRCSGARRANVTQVMNRTVGTRMRYSV